MKRPKVGYYGTSKIIKEGITESKLDIKQLNEYLKELEKYVDHLEGSVNVDEYVSIKTLETNM